MDGRTPIVEHETPNFDRKFYRINFESPLGMKQHDVCCSPHLLGNCCARSADESAGNTARSIQSFNDCDISRFNENQLRSLLTTNITQTHYVGKRLNILLQILLHYIRFSPKESGMYFLKLFSSLNKVLYGNSLHTSQCYHCSNISLKLLCHWITSFFLSPSVSLFLCCSSFCLENI